jgi:hypothetical protein
MISIRLTVLILKYTKLPFTFCFNGCETWSFTLREAHRWTVFENRTLRRIFGANREELAGDRRKIA